MGWKVHLADNKRIVFRKKLKDMTRTDHDTLKLLENLINLKI